MSRFEPFGRALAGRRNQVVIATKFGVTFDESTRHITGENASPEDIRRACEASLKRLNTETIDLYQFHLGRYDLDQAGVVRDTLEELVAEGKIRHYGWSTDFPECARVFAEGPNCSAAQFQMNVLDDATLMVALCEELNLAGINRGPLAMGLLTGKYGKLRNLC
jgi:aryl-alcohol dehydrogenase-like predicted oxidoreductase